MADEPMPAPQERTYAETMPLTDVVLRMIQKQQWDDELIRNREENCSSFVTKLAADGQNYRLFIEVDEEHRTVSVYLYTAFNVTPDRMTETARLFNQINRHLLLGRLCCADDGEPNPVQFAVSSDFTDSMFSLAQLEVMIEAAFWTFRNYGKAVALAAFSTLNAQEIWALREPDGQDKSMRQIRPGVTIQ